MVFSQMSSQSRHGCEGLLAELAAKERLATTPDLSSVRELVGPRPFQAQVTLMLILLTQAWVRLGAVPALEGPWPRGGVSGWMFSVPMFRKGLLIREVPLALRAGELDP